MSSSIEATANSRPEEALSMHSEAERPTWRLRFSLRELLLLTTAVAAILTLTIQNWPRRYLGDQSAFFNRFNYARLVQDSLVNLGEQAGFPNAASSSGLVSRRISTKEFTISYAVTKTEPHDLVGEIRTRLQKQIEESGAEVMSVTLHLDAARKKSQGLSIAYRDGGICGVVHIAAGKEKPSVLRVTGWIYDFADMEPAITPLQK